MQKIKLLGLITAMVIAQSACSNLKDTLADMQVSEPVQLIDRGLEMVLTYKESGFAMKQTATFEPAAHQSDTPADTLCKSYTVCQTFPNIQMAEYAYQEAIDSLTEKEINHIRLAMNNTAVTYHLSQYEGYSKNVVRTYMELLYNTRKLIEETTDPNEKIQNSGFHFPDISIITPIDDDTPGIDDNNQENNTDDDSKKYNPQYYESEDGLFINFSWNQFTIGVHHSYDVQFGLRSRMGRVDTLCTQYKVTDTYTNELYALWQYELIDLIDLGNYGYALDGAVITHTDPYEVGMPKSSIKRYFLEMQERLLMFQ